MNSLKVIYEQGRCEEITINGISLMNCSKAIIAIRAGEAPQLVVTYPIKDIEMLIDDIHTDKR